MLDEKLRAYAENYLIEHKTTRCVFSYNQCLYKVQKYKSGQLKLKEICTGVPSITGAENLGDKNSPKWHYKFKIESKTYGEVNLLLSPKEFSSNYTL